MVAVPAFPIFNCSPFNRSVLGHYRPNLQVVEVILRCIRLASFGWLCITIIILVRIRIERQPVDSAANSDLTSLRSPFIYCPFSHAGLRSGHRFALPSSLQHNNSRYTRSCLPFNISTSTAFQDPRPRHLA
ncbi:hypothetical protein P152DRAFT_312702 [Eremomyces bilateralis CBS 781.70]|uniref:Uncharacterized protein n=1 Tax=Eremomyces bilateralis CBS 781.70 TaxID=1392243 RepID=A0A6G1G5Y9_9PEZI|nr:uncharacterized protein P152DRAFT_312702 [Eremomyces bilateralis CBS 781.70]KAF1813290.1 hypothetical protein P152DRAFT_312702 [Eremomyces bilateralis CBS 781.70]